MNEVYEDTINYLKYYGEKNHSKIENIACFLDCELKNYIKLQSNWNSLREWLEEQIAFTRSLIPTTEEINRSHKQQIAVYSYVLDKMNELEGENNGHKSKDV